MKNTDTAQEKGYDAGKKISGIKRHIAVDTQGLPHAIHITTANITDRGGALEMFSWNEDVLSDVENVLVDGGYSGYSFANGVERLLHCKVEVAKRSELHTFNLSFGLSPLILEDFGKYGFFGICLFFGQNS